MNVKVAKELIKIANLIISNELSERGDSEFFREQGAKNERN